MLIHCTVGCKTWPYGFQLYLGPWQHLSSFSRELSLTESVADVSLSDLPSFYPHHHSLPSNTGTSPPFSSPHSPSFPPSTHKHTHTHKSPPRISPGSNNVPHLQCQWYNEQLKWRNLHVCWWCKENETLNSRNRWRNYRVITKLH